MSGGGDGAGPFGSKPPFEGFNPFGSLNPFEALQAMGTALGQGTQSFAQLQNSLMQQMAGRMAGGVAGGLGGVPLGGADGFQSALGAYQRALASALDVSGSVAKRLHEGGSTDPVVAEMLGKIFDPRGWVSGMSEMDSALSRMAEGPQLSDLWTIERKFAAVFTAWAAMRRRSLEHNTVMLDAWTRAVGAFSAELNRHAAEGKQLESWRDVASLWIDTANGVLLETQRSEAFLASQREMLKAATDLRLAQQEVAEFYGDMFGLPTRTEIDDVHKSLTDLRREVRALRRELRGRRPSPALAAPEAGSASAVQAEMSHG